MLCICLSHPVYIVHICKASIEWVYTMPYQLYWRGSWERYWSNTTHIISPCLWWLHVGLTCSCPEAGILVSLWNFQIKTNWACYFENTPNSNQRNMIRQIKMIQRKGVHAYTIYIISESTQIVCIKSQDMHNPLSWNQTKTSLIHSTFQTASRDTNFPSIQLTHWLWFLLREA